MNVGQRSPPTRGVWIEIHGIIIGVFPLHGHPPHGGCGLKLVLANTKEEFHVSPPTRGVWIEIASGICL